METVQQFKPGIPHIFSFDSRVHKEEETRYGGLVDLVEHQGPYELHYVPQ